MHEYIDHFEIESKLPRERGKPGGWKHVANVYPKYKWRIWRPWYFLGLVERLAISNEREAWTTCFDELTNTIVYLPKPQEEVRLVTWMRLGRKLIRAGDMKLC